MRQRRVYRKVPVMLLLFLLTSGVFLMHTLGHFGSDDAMPAGHHGAVVVNTAMIHDGGQVAAGDVPQDPAVPVGSMVLCLAILCALVVLGMAAMMARRRAAVGRGLDRLPGLVVEAVRGPPKVRIGLILADLSVLRN